MIRTLATVVALHAAIAAAAVAQHEYLLDDSRGNALGPAFDEWDMVFLNAFDVVPGADKITAVRVCWGSARAGIPAQVMIFEDPDGDGSPADAEWIAGVPAVTTPAGNGVFQEYTFPHGVTICGPRFFVGVRVTLGSAARGVNPARLDWEAVALADHAYLAVGSTVNSQNFLDLSHLGRAPIFYRMDTFTFPGTWLVRAIGEPSQSDCGGDWNGDGFLDGFDYDAFVACFEAQECPRCRTADFNGDGFADGFDYDDFVLAFETGC